MQTQTWREERGARLEHTGIRPNAIGSAVPSRGTSGVRQVARVPFDERHCIAGSSNPYLLQAVAN